MALKASVFKADKITSSEEYFHNGISFTGRTFKSHSHTNLNNEKFTSSSIMTRLKNNTSAFNAINNKP